MGCSEEGNILLLQFPVVPLPASRDIIAEHLQAAPAATGPDPHRVCNQSDNAAISGFSGNIKRFSRFCSFEERVEIDRGKERRN